MSPHCTTEKHSEKTAHITLSVSNIFLRAAKTLSEQFLEFQKFPIASSEITNLVITRVLLKQTEHLNLKRKRTNKGQETTQRNWKLSFSIYVRIQSFQPQVPPCNTDRI